MDAAKKVKIFYNTEETLSHRMLVALSLQQLVVFLPLIVMPIFIVLQASSQLSLLYHFLAFAMFGCAISTLLLSCRAHIGGSCYLPVTFATPLFSLLLMFAPKGDIGLFISVGVAVGFIQLCLTPLLRWCKIIFNLHLAGFITMLLGIWVAQMGIIALFSPDNISPLMFHKFQQGEHGVDLKQLAIGFLTLGVIFTFRLSNKRESRIFCLLYGSIAGWLIAWLTGSLAKGKVALLMGAPWFSLPSFSFIHFSSLNTNLVFPIIIASFVLTMQLFSMMSMIQHENDGESDTDVFANRNARVNMASSLGVVLSSMLGMPLAPNAAAFGVLGCTGVFSKKIGYGVAFFMCLLAFSPKVLMCFMTIPASVRGATILFIGSAMFMYGFAITNFNELRPLHRLIYILSLLVGTSITIEPTFYHSPHVWISAVTNPMFFIALIVFIFCHLIFSRFKGTW